VLSALFRRSGIRRELGEHFAKACGDRRTREHVLGPCHIHPLEIGGEEEDRSLTRAFVPKDQAVLPLDVGRDRLWWPIEVVVFEQCIAQVDEAVRGRDVASFIDEAADSGGIVARNGNQSCRIENFHNGSVADDASGFAAPELGGAMRGVVSKEPTYCRTGQSDGENADDYELAGDS
jgi:hypothetical protein